MWAARIVFWSLKLSGHWSWIFRTFQNHLEKTCSATWPSWSYSMKRRISPTTKTKSPAASSLLAADANQVLTLALSLGWSKEANYRFKFCQKYYFWWTPLLGPPDSCKICRISSKIRLTIQIITTNSCQVGRRQNRPVITKAKKPRNK